MSSVTTKSRTREHGRSLHLGQSKSKRCKPVVLKVEERSNVTTPSELRR